MKKTAYLIILLFCALTAQAQTAPQKQIPEFYPLVENYNYISKHYSDKWDRIYTEMIKTHKRNEHQRPMEGKCGENVFWKIDTNEYKLTISGSGEMDYSYFDHKWFMGAYYYYIESVEIEDNITSVCEAAFENMRIQRVSFGKSVKKIANHAFSYCLLLWDLKGIENISFIGDSAFIHTGAMSLDLPLIERLGSGVFRSSNITKISIGNNLKKLNEQAFYGCPALKQVVFSQETKNKLKVIEAQTFEACYNLNSVLLPPKTTTIGKSAFSNCEELKEINIPGTVNTIGDNAFYACAKLKQVTIPSKVKEIPDGCFNGCFALSNIEIPKGVTKLGRRAFSQTVLENIMIPEGVVEIGEACFYLCDFMLNIELPSTITSIGNAAFEGTTLLQTITVPCNVLDKYKATEAMANIKDKIICNEN